MKTFLLTLILFLALMFTQAQNVYSLSGQGDRAIQFEQIENLQTQKVELSKSDAQMQLHTNAVRNALLDGPNSKLMAALAYDAQSNTLVYMPMISSYVYFRNVDTQSLDRVDALKEIHVAACNQGSQFSRMTMAPNGKAYALNNDFSEMIEIDPVTHQVKNLGAFTVPSNNSKNAKEFWGGDMFADSENNLYVVSAYGSLYKISLENKTVNHLGALENMPEGFTTNGAAVLANGDILVSNAKGEGLYYFHLNDLSLKKYSETSKPSYDLASGFFVPVSSEELIADNGFGLQLYPTVVDQENINLRSDKDLRNMTIQVYDTNSFLVADFKSRKLNAGDETNFNLSHLRPNIYIVKAFDDKGNEVLNQKITVTR